MAPASRRGSGGGGGVDRSPLTALSGLCSELDASLDAVVLPSLALTRFAVGLRYPGEIEQPSVAEVREWLAVARTIFDAICSRLPRETHPDCSGHRE